MTNADQFRAGLERIGELSTRVAPLVRRLLVGESIGETGDNGSDEPPDLDDTLRMLRYELEQFATGARLTGDQRKRLRQIARSSVCEGALRQSAVETPRYCTFCGERNNKPHVPRCPRPRERDAEGCSLTGIENTAETAPVEKAK